MFEYIRADLKRHLCCDGRENNSLLWKLFIIVFAYGFHASTVYRFGYFIDRRLQRGVLYPIYLVADIAYLLCKFLTEKMYGIRIDRRAVIGKGFYIGHFGGIEINNCQIGINCNVHQLVKIGSGCVLGNNIWLGAHAVIKDEVIIADFATVMVGAKVVAPVCSYCLSSGAPARIINKKYDNTKLLGLDYNCSFS